MSDMDTSAQGASTERRTLRPHQGFDKLCEEMPQLAPALQAAHTYGIPVKQIPAMLRAIFQIDIQTTLLQNAVRGSGGTFTSFIERQNKRISAQSEIVQLVDAQVRVYALTETPHKFWWHDAESCGYALVALRAHDTGQLDGYAFARVISAILTRIGASLTPPAQPAAFTESAGANFLKRIPAMFGSNEAMSTYLQKRSSVPTQDATIIVNEIIATDIRRKEAQALFYAPYWQNEHVRAIVPALFELGATIPCITHVIKDIEPSSTAGTSSIFNLQKRFSIREKGAPAIAQLKHELYLAYGAPAAALLSSAVEYAQRAKEEHEAASKKNKTREANWKQDPKTAALVGLLLKEADLTLGDIQRVMTEEYGVVDSETSLYNATQERRTHDAQTQDARQQFADDILQKLPTNIVHAAQKKIPALIQHARDIKARNRKTGSEKLSRVFSMRRVIKAFYTYSKTPEGDRTMRQAVDVLLKKDIVYGCQVHCINRTTPGTQKKYAKKFNKRMQLVVRLDSVHQNNLTKDARYIRRTIAFIARYFAQPTSLRIQILEELRVKLAAQGIREFEFSQMQGSGYGRPKSITKQIVGKL